MTVIITFFFKGKIKLVNFDYKVTICLWKNLPIFQIKQMLKTTDLRFLFSMAGDLFVWDGKSVPHDSVIHNLLKDTPLYLKGIFYQDYIAVSPFTSETESIFSEQSLDELWNTCDKLFTELYGSNYKTTESNGFEE